MKCYGCIIVLFTNIFSDEKVNGEMMVVVLTRQLHINNDNGNSVVIWDGGGDCVIVILITIYSWFNNLFFPSTLPNVIN